ncbi:tyrosine-type recombinase/integrase [Methanolobus sp.]|uniref:tyrosine-type recombinase/integrase n=1 Tax=Methanolobus sp. TaxID=1874737 RepID=UPI00273148B0|nr:tyrosine-type recombinase/integrase [Methanolobus sp.]
MNSYDKDAKMNSGHSAKTRADRAIILSKLAIYSGKPFKEMTEDDIRAYLFSLDVAPVSLDNYKAHIKKFFKWLYKTDIDPECTRWLKFRSTKKRKLPDDILTMDEVKALINAADNVRDQTLIAMFYDTAARLGEVLGLNQGHVNADSFGFFIMVNGKTGTRRIRLTISAPYVKSLLNSHPCKGANNPLFYTQAGTRMSDSLCRSIIKTLVQRAGIEKRVHAHLFRHTRMTHLAEDLTEQQLKVFAGWTGDSKMSGIYVHLSGADVDNKILELSGMKSPDERKEAEDTLKPKVCGRCNEVNAVTNMYCFKCGMAMTKEAESNNNDTIAAVLDKLKEHPEILLEALGKVNK